MFGLMRICGCIGVCVCVGMDPHSGVYVCDGANTLGDVSVGDGEWTGMWRGVRGVQLGDCVCVRVCVSAVMSGVCVFDRVCRLRSKDGVLRLSIVLQSASSGGEVMRGCSLSGGGWMEMQGGLIFFFRWQPPTDWTLTGNARTPFSHHCTSALISSSS